jgi:N6-adenosine-specific RNA methylase IME4
MELFSTVIADPPWSLNGGPGWGGGKSRPLPYPVMDVDAICALGVRHWCAPDSHLYLWVPNAYVEAAYRVARAWGFKPSTLLVWCKPITGGGLGGTYRLNTEFVLFARRGSLKAKEQIGQSAFHWPRQRRHSQKPEAFTDLVERVSPGPYLELFARRARFGWSYAGNQSLGDVEIDGLDPPTELSNAVRPSHDRAECPRCLTEHGSDDCPS